MKFTLTIELGNDAMQSAGDIGQILTDAAHKLQYMEDVNGCYPADWEAFDRKTTIKNENGNTVGKWEVTA